MPTKLCECGCNGEAPIATKTAKRDGHVKGEPMRFIRGHKGRVRGMCPPNPIALCQCGCGGEAPIAPQTSKRFGWVKGEPMRYIVGHYARTLSRPLAERFWAMVDKNGPLPSAEAVAVHPEIKGERCWIYGKLGAKHRSIRLEARPRRQVPVYHVAWYLQTGKWPEPQCLHKCDRGGCVRPSHLFEGTQQDNVRDMIKKHRDRIVGSRNLRAKFTDEDIREIRRIGAPCVRHPRKRGTTLLVKRLAERKGATTDHIWAILRNKIWKRSPWANDEQKGNADHIAAVGVGVGLELQSG
jgi:hypothetical protein